MNLFGVDPRDVKLIPRVSIQYLSADKCIDESFEVIAIGIGGSDGVATES
jgi:hypothetical protein